jgi:hypothetical protein
MPEKTYDDITARSRANTRLGPIHVAADKVIRRRLPNRREVLRGRYSLVEETLKDYHRRFPDLPPVVAETARHALLAAAQRAGLDMYRPQAVLDYFAARKKLCRLGGRDIVYGNPRATGSFVAWAEASYRWSRGRFRWQYRGGLSVKFHEEELVLLRKLGEPSEVAHRLVSALPTIADRFGGNERLRSVLKESRP